MMSSSFRSKRRKSKRRKDITKSFGRNNSLKPSLERIKRRRKEVVRDSIRSKKYSTKQLTKEASSFIKFTRTLEKSRKNE